MIYIHKSYRVITIINIFYLYLATVTVDKPSPPRKLRVLNIGKDYIDVTSDGNSPIMNYVVKTANATADHYTLYTDNDTPLPPCDSLNCKAVFR